MMKNYKSIRNFYEAMQQRPHQQEQKHYRQRMNTPKQEPELSIKKVIEFFKGIKP